MSLASALSGGTLDDLPGRRDENWRWTDLRTALAVLPERSPAGSPPEPSPHAAGFDGDERLILNGRAPQQSAEPIGGRLQRRFVSAAAGCGHDVADDIDVAPGQSLVILDLFEGLVEGYVSSVRGAFRLAPGARVERLVLCDDPDDAVSIGAFDVSVAEGARFAQTTLCAGAHRQRMETNVVLEESAELRLDGLYLLAGRRHSDQTTQVVHAGRDAKSRQLVKGLAADQSRSVFQGRIVVARGAAGADARMGSHGLILGDRAEIDAKPELEIYADDVQCAHGNTVGALPRHRRGGGQDPSRCRFHRRRP
jgi:Fe-S cluster assembly protein SufD